MLIDYFRYILGLGVLLLTILGFCVILGCGVNKPQDTSTGKLRMLESNNALRIQGWDDYTNLRISVYEYGEIIRKYGTHK